MKKKMLAVLLAGTMAASMTACGGSSSSNTADTTAAAKEAGDSAEQTGEAKADAKDASEFKIGLITDVGGVNDGSFNQSSWEGLERAGEELGVTAAPADLHECGLRRFRFEAEFHGKPFKDNQVSKVFCLWLDREAEDFAVQKSEIDYVKWFDLDEAVAAVEQGTIPNCIFPEELGMVKKFVGQTGGAR